MSTMEKPPPYLSRPARTLTISWIAYSVIVVAIFVGVEAWLPGANSMKPIIAMAPGISLGGFLGLLFLYFRHYDEMLKTLLLKSLSASALVGIVIQLGSIVRANTTEFAPINDAFVIGVMAVAFIVTALFLKWQHR